MKRGILLNCGLVFAALLATGSLYALQQQTPNPASPSLLAAKAKMRRLPIDGNQAMTLAALRSQNSLKPNPAVSAMLSRWQDAAQVLGPRTIVMLDPRTGGPASVQPDGLPWIPGNGVNNHLTRADLSAVMPQSDAPADDRDPADRNGVNQAVLERIARNFMSQHPNWFPVPQNQLVSRILELDPNDTVRHVIFNQVVNGVPVENAMLVFHINHGNLISFGGQFLAPVTVSTTPVVVPGDALALSFNYSEVADLSQVEEVTAPRLKLILRDDTGAANGAGYQHQLVYEHVFRVRGENPTWRTEIDAMTGAVLGFSDTNEYNNTVFGGSYPVSNDGVCPTGCEEAAAPMAYTYYNGTGSGSTVATACTGGSLTTDTGGNYPTATAGTVRFTDCGPYVVTLNGSFCTGASHIVNDSVTAPASINLGTSAFTAAGTDCAVPTNGNPNPLSAGDNHAVRSATYNINKYKEAIRGWRPVWAFLNGRTQVNVNINSVCNAFWNGSSLNMYKFGTTSGVTCRNSGEIPAVFDHEIGHGFSGSENTARPNEAYADSGSILHHRDACFGRGFFTARQCGGYGDACTNCTGVRGADWTGHVASRPHTILDGQSGNNTAPNTNYQCPAGSDICGFETHCAAYPIIESVWDAANIDLPHNAIPANGGAACAGTSPGNAVLQAQAWTLFERAWWLSSPSMGDFYACNTTGTAGCGAATLFHLIKVQEDDNGNLTDGTPHAAELQCAFARHQVGCTTDTNTDSGCAAPIGTPTLTATPSGPNGMNLSWTAATNAATYRVFRGEEGCGSGGALIATVTAPTVVYADTGLASGRTYYYYVQAVSSTVQCDGDPSSCQTVVAGGPACSAPTGLANNTAVDAGTSCNATGITVTWTAPTAWGDTSGARTWNVLRNGVAVASGPCSGALTEATLTCTDTTAVAGTAYTYSVKAINGCASSTTTAGVSATDLTGAVPSGLANNSAADISACAATGNSVTWTAPTGWNDNGSGARTWTVLRNGVAVAAGSCSGAIVETTLTCNDTSAVAGTAYTYTVRANNGCALQTVTAPGAGATDAVGVAPSGVNAPTVGDVSACNASGINVTWTTPTWGAAAGTYIVLRDGVAVASGTCSGSFPAATLTCVDSTAPAGSHTYQVRATNGCAMATTSVASGAVSDLSGAVPSGLANNTAADISACAATGNAVTWTAPTGWNDNGSGARTWTVLRNGVAVAAGPCSGAIAETTLSCNDTSALTGTTYTYTVRANNGCALQTTTAGTTATDLSGSNPTGLANNGAADISACAATGNAVTWTAPTGWNDNASGARTWTVLRGGVAVAAGPCSGALTETTLNCNDTSAVVNTAYTYTLRANNGCGNQTTTAGTSATDLTGSVPSGLANNSAADISSCAATGNSVTWTAPTGWNDNGSGARTYTVLRGGVAVAAGPCSGVLPVGTLTCNDTSAVVNTAYTYTLRANNGCALQTTTAGASATDLTGSAPTGLANNTAADISACAATGNAVSWTVPAAWNDNGSGVDTFTVLRNGVAVAAGPCSGALPLSTLSCNDTSAVVNTAYTYSLRANNGCGIQTTTAGNSATDLTGSAPSGFANNGAADADICAFTGNAVTWTAPTGWNDNASGSRTYDVLRNGTPVASGLAAASTNYTDATAVAGTPYTYTVRANNGCALNTTSAGNSATDLADTTAPSWAVPSPQSLAKTANIDFSWPSAEAGATYTSYSAATPNPVTWNSRNTTGTLAWSDAADLGDANSYFYTTTAKDACNNESPK